MKSYVIRNGKLQTREKDYNVPTYRILPYNKTINPTPNDYLQTTIKQQLQKYIDMEKQYWKLNKVLWKLIQQVDKTQYDNPVSLFGLSQEDIMKRISFIRNIQKSIQEKNEELNLSEIKKIEFGTIQQNSQEDSQQRLQIDRNILNNQRISIGRQSESSHLDSRMKHRLSLALNQQQDLRRILQDEVQKLNIQLNIKNQQLQCVIGDIQMKNSLIAKLKDCRSQKSEFIKNSINRSNYSPSSQSKTLEISSKYLGQKEDYLQNSQNCQKIKNINDQIQGIIQELILVSEQQWYEQEQNYKDQNSNNLDQQQSGRISQFVLVSLREDRANISKQQIEDSLKNVPMIKSIQVSNGPQLEANKQNLPI